VGEQPRERDAERQRQGHRDREGGNPRAEPAGDDPLIHDDDDRSVRQVEAVRRRAEAAERARVQ
jgi:hypothetical protein